MLMAALTHCVLRVTFDARGKPAGQEKMLTELNQRFRDLRVGPDGDIYLLTDETFGRSLLDEQRVGGFRENHQAVGLRPEEVRHRRLHAAEWDLVRQFILGKPVVVEKQASAF